MARPQQRPAALQSEQLITHAAAEILAQDSREAALLATRQQPRTSPRQIALAVATLALALALTLINARRLAPAASASPPAPSAAQMETGIKLAIGEAEETFADTGAFPERLEIVDELQEGWSYERLSPQRFRVSWSTPDRTAMYDSEKRRVEFTDGGTS